MLGMLNYKRPIMYKVETNFSILRCDLQSLEKINLGTNKTSVLVHKLMMTQVNCCMDTKYCTLTSVI